MGRSVTLRPNGMVTAGGGYWFRYPGSVAIGTGDWPYLQDNDDGTYFYGIMSNVDTFGLEFTSYALAGDERCSEARLIQRIGGTSDTFQMGLESWIGVGAGNMGYGDGGGATYDGIYYRWQHLWNPGYGADWSQAAIDNLRAYYRKLDRTTTPAISEAYIDLWVQTRPTVSMTGPVAGSVVMSQQPTVTWNYDNKGDTVRAHQVKVFTEAVRVGAGFNPDTSATVWDSGRVNGAATSATVGVALSYGQAYYVYVRVATDFRSTDWWSNWANTWFVINTPPTVSNVTITPTPVAGEVTTTNTPTIGWTFSDVDLDGQYAWYVRLFPESVYNAAGFNFNTDTGASWVASGTNTATRSATTSALSPGVNYKAYVWVSDQGINGRWSGPAISAAFKIVTATGVLFDPPAPPAVAAVTTDQGAQRVVITVEGRDNYLTRNQSTIDTGVVGWENAGGGNLTRETAVVAHGGGALRQTTQWTTGAALDMFARAAPGSAYVVPVTPGRTYTALAQSRAGQATTRSTRVDIRWHDAAGTWLSTSSGTASANAQGAYAQRSVTAVAPANAAWAVLQLAVLATAVAGEYHLWDSMSIAPGSSLTWYRGGFVLDAGRLSDAFNRANNASSLGTADAGGAWAALTGTWGVIDGKAYSPYAAGVDKQAVLTSNFLADGYVEADVTFSPTTDRTHVGLVFRANDANNFLVVDLTKNAGMGAGVTNLRLMKRVAGAYTVLDQVTGLGFTDGSTHKLRVEFYGGQIYVDVDGVRRISRLLLAGEHAQFGAYGKYGLQTYHAANSDDGGSRFDNFKAGLTPTQRVTLERSLDSGLNWEKVRGAVSMDLGVTQQAVVYDYEVPAGKIAQYRAVTTASEAGTTFTSPYSDLGFQPSILTVDRWWLKDPQAPSLNMSIEVQPGFRFRRKEAVEFFEPIGRTQSVFVSDGPKGVEGELSIWSKNQTTFAALEAILRTGRPLILQSPLGHSWWVKFADQDWDLLRAQRTATDPTYSAIRHFHQLSLSFTEVAAPAVV